MGNGLPVINITAKTLPEAWEEAVIKTWELGLSIKTEYDKPDDPPSKDATVIMTALEPMLEPRIHRAFPGGLEDLEVYRQEVVNGIHDHWINPAEGKWTYTYHQRIASYPSNGQTIDQMAYIIAKLKDKEYTRRAQAITWSPKLDSVADDPPCLQRIWFRISRDKYNKAVLNMNTHWRSRDAYKAAFMNMFALTDLQKIIAQKLSSELNEQVSVGRYTDVTDSFHIYGSYHEEFGRFLETVRKRSFKERTWNSKFAEPFFEEARRKIEKETKC
ncbi:MAG: thymidylate synthase [Candidatus Omnitrophota bacterium]